jgi:hypothetical protein
MNSIQSIGLTPKLAETVRKVKKIQMDKYKKREDQDDVNRFNELFLRKRNASK